MRRPRLHLGRRGRTEKVILRSFRDPWGLYLSVRTPMRLRVWKRGRVYRLRLAFGPRFGKPAVRFLRSVSVYYGPWLRLR